MICYIVYFQVENVKLLDRFNIRKPCTGTLYLTTTHLIFIDNDGKKECWILHSHMSSVEKLAITTAGCPIQIRCKNFMNITFLIHRERDSHDIYTSLMELSKPDDIENLYAFQFSTQDSMPKSFGWSHFDLQSEYLRMGAPNKNWVMSNLNLEYELCDTYSKYIFVPAVASTPVIMGSSKFRSRGRLPALSYLHRENQASISRCSQPLSGFSARCVEDEQMLQAVLKSNPNSKYMFVVDTRPKINAMANKAAGKGYENENFYSNIKFQFLGIENIHVMRGSLQKLLEVCELKSPSMNSFLTGLENSNWLKHIKAVVDTSAFIATAVQEGINVLVHCSDGWDRTAQTCSLASLMLDPYYRTIQGFQALIEKEWLAFGHKFTDRCGFLSTVDSKENSPVFTQFLESVWQISQQFPCAFQFNERFLIAIHDHVYSCQFGTFIGNCEKDRIDLRLSERTYSLWGYVAQHINEFSNPLFKKEYELTHSILIPNTSPQCFKFWRGLYNRFENGIHPREPVMDILSANKDHSNSLEDHVALLEKRVTQICKLLGKSDDIIQRKLQGFLSVDSLDGILADHVDNNALPQKFLRSSLMSRSNVEERDATLESSLILGSPSTDLLTIDQLVSELKTVAIDWRSFRRVYNCTCAAPFDHYVKKFHCWKCGEIFCGRCITKNIPLPGHYSRRPVPVCKPCYLQVRSSPSPELPTS
ncbi:hypothetical protein LOTGIDRAFT_125960 [Lottia gigantea]|uniref:phosphatidylinositol-3,5-bisphosphate 3-phosphatase n=1 Tax=Lottia gigantea TaxID=225164 RepID=V4A0L8_LOTGI|nr:hypothetical protein LOTGIDRAFT_125960 [Lottia gigantea]ESO88450.1 hypothetical protein LOTGIDRAFT_125960 [Lottia gigantea]